MTDQLPAWIFERVRRRTDGDDATAHPVELQREYDRAVLYFGLPLPEEDPYADAHRRQLRHRIERFERTFGSMYDRGRFVDADA